jgi:hypothetical protein
LLFSGLTTAKLPAPHTKSKIAEFPCILECEMHQSGRRQTATRIVITNHKTRPDNGGK